MKPRLIIIRWYKASPFVWWGAIGGIIGPVSQLTPWQGILTVQQAATGAHGGMMACYLPGGCTQLQLDGAISDEPDQRELLEAEIMQLRREIAERDVVIGRLQAWLREYEPEPKWEDAF